MSVARVASTQREGEAALAGSQASRPRVLVFTTLFPNPAQPLRAPFVRHRVAATARHCPTRVVAPILRRTVGDGIAGVEPAAELEVTHPPYTTLPLLGRCADGFVLYRQTLAHVQRIHAEFPFDVIDAHYAFPDGAAATLLAARFRVPVAVTVRGGDLDLLPRFRLRRRAIERTLRRADRIFAVSDHLAARAVELGAPPRSILVVPNGVDREVFFHADGESARRRLGVAADRALVVCAGNLLAEKGQHVLVEALARIGTAGRRPDLVLIGSDPSPSGAYRRRLERDVERLGLGGRVRLLGSVDQRALADWYRAADLLVLPTFREGCPNVVREALACGTPVVASRVGGVPELVTSQDLGLLVAPGDGEALAGAMEEALRRTWNRAAIAACPAARDWSTVGAALAKELAGLAGRPDAR